MPSDGADLDETLDSLAQVQQDLAAALRRASVLVPVVKEAIPGLTDGLEEEPLEAILREVLAAKAQATADREVTARLVVLVDRLKITADRNGSGLDRLESAGKRVAEKLAAAQRRADGVDGEPGAAADAGMKSPTR